MRKNIPERFRDLKYSHAKAGSNGLFWIPAQKGNHTLKVIISDGGGWDHVSVSLPNRCPNWPEMCFIKDLFFEPDETALQFHPAVEHYVNNHPYCLHIWRSQTDVVDLPPSEFVGFKSLNLTSTDSSATTSSSHSISQTQLKSID